MKIAVSIHFRRIATAYGMLLAGVWFFLHTYAPEEVIGLLVDKSYLWLSINCVLIFFGVMLNGQALRQTFNKIPPRVRLALLAIITAGVLLATLTAPMTHRIYYDEDIYQNIGQNLAHLHRAQMCNDGMVEYGVFTCNHGEYNKQPSGYPYLLAVVFQIFGTSEPVAFLLNHLLLGVALLTTFLLGSHCFKSFRAGLFSALILALIPQNLIWHNTTAAEPSAALFAALAVLSAFHAVREKSVEALFLLVTISAFTLHIRPESWLILVVLLLILGLGWQQVWRRGRFYWAGWLLTLLSVPAFLHVWAMRNNPWGSAASPFGLDYFWGNFAVNFWFYWDNARFPLFFTLLALVGVLTQAFWRERLILWVWFLLFWGVFLFFYAGSYNYGADIRYSLLSYLPLALLAGGSAHGLTERLGRLLGRSVSGVGLALAGLIIMMHSAFLPQIRAVTQEAWAARADHRFALQMFATLPANAMVLTHNPGMFQVWGQSAAQSSIASNGSKDALRDLFAKYRGGVYFHFNFWCSVADPLQRSFCNRILQNYPNELVKEYHEQHYRYALYRLLPPRE